MTRTRAAEVSNHAVSPVSTWANSAGAVAEGAVSSAATTVAITVKSRNAAKNQNGGLFKTFAIYLSFPFASIVYPTDINRA
jgi:hypothetical protein